MSGEKFLLIYSILSLPYFRWCNLIVDQPAASDDYHLFPILQSRLGCRNAEIEHGHSRRDLLQILSMYS